METLSAIWGASWRIGVFICMWGGLFAPFVMAGRRHLGELQAAPAWFRPYIEGIALATMLLAGWVMLHFIDKRPFVSIGFSPEVLGTDLLVGVAVGAGMIALTLAILWLSGRLRVTQKDNMPRWSIIPAAFLAVLCNVVTQEVLVRGYILQTLQIHVGTLAALVGSSLLFVAFHLPRAKESPLSLVNCFLMGLLFGYLYLATGNLWGPIALHLVWNLSLGPVLGMNVSGLGLKGSPLYWGWSVFHVEGAGPVSGGGFGVEGGLAATLATVAGLLALYLLYPHAVA